MGRVIYKESHEAFTVYLVWNRYAMDIHTVEYYTIKINRVNLQQGKKSHKHNALSQKQLQKGICNSPCKIFKLTRTTILYIVCEYAKYKRTIPTLGKQSPIKRGGRKGCHTALLL